MNYDEQLAAVNAEMESTEDELCADLGFPVEQWVLIRRYILAAISSNQLLAMKILAGTPPEEAPPGS